MAIRWDYDATERVWHGATENPDRAYRLQQESDESWSVKVTKPEFGDGWFRADDNKRTMVDALEAAEYHFWYYG